MCEEKKKNNFAHKFNEIVRLYKSLHTIQRHYDGFHANFTFKFERLLHIRNENGIAKLLTLTL